ncbi:MAG: squalene--hopene cyclase, partial [Thermoanaerobaculia bacterium]
LHYLGRLGEERVCKAANYLRREQLAKGGWAIYRGGPADVSASVKAYFVLKLLGDAPDAPHMAKARRAILEMGGLDACNSYTKLYLSIFCQFDWDDAPTVPPEIVLFPTWFPFHIYRMSAWTRAIVVPLSIMWALKPQCQVPEHATISELRTSGPPQASPVLGGEGGRLWAAFFRLIDGFYKLLERLRLRPFRRLALERAERWVLDRLVKSDGVGAIFPPIVNTIYALDMLGYSHDDPVFESQVRELEKLEIEEGDTLRVQPCFSPVWDTSQALNALLEAELPADHSALMRAARWLLDREVQSVGDWKVNNPGGEVGGWYFEYANESYPDCDDTAEVLTALQKARFPAADRERAEQAKQRGLKWLLSMQNRDGGWASFDKGCDQQYLTYIPFADHNAMIDPSTSDITARVLETLACYGFGRSSPVVRKAVEFLLREQEPDGSWYGRWGCNYLYGTWLALWGLKAIGEDATREWGRRAASWLRSCQNPDGGWGELPSSYDDPSLKGQGPSSASQTSWALMGLFAAGDFTSQSVERGLAYLMAAQQEDGGWQEELWTGTGFPRVFYLRYHYYCLYFPLLALATYERWVRTGADPTPAVGPRPV